MNRSRFFSDRLQISNIQIFKKGITHHLITNSIRPKFKYSDADLFGWSAPHEMVRKRKKNQSADVLISSESIMMPVTNELIKWWRIYYLCISLFLSAASDLPAERKIAPPGAGQPAAPAGGTCENYLSLPTNWRLPVSIHCLSRFAFGEASLEEEKNELKAAGSSWNISSRSAAIWIDAPTKFHLLSGRDKFFFLPGPAATKLVHFHLATVLEEDPFSPFCLV